MEITDDDLKEMGKNLSDGKLVTPEFQKGINTLIGYISHISNLTVAMSNLSQVQANKIADLEGRIKKLETDAS